jgi:hypothetical protein
MSIGSIGDGIALREKGDILSSDGTSGYRVPVGTDGQVLQSQSSAASGLIWTSLNTGETQKWVHISTTTVSSGTITAILNNIPQTYKTLVLVAAHEGGTGSGVSDLDIRINGSTATSTHAYSIQTNLATASTVSYSTTIADKIGATQTPQNDGYGGILYMLIHNYTNSTGCSGELINGYWSEQSSGTARARLNHGVFSLTGAAVPVQSIHFYVPSGFTGSSQGSTIDFTDDNATMFDLYGIAE